MTRFSQKASGLARGVKSLLGAKDGPLQDEKTDVRQPGGPDPLPKGHQALRAEYRRKLANIRQEISHKERELERINGEFYAAKEWAKRIEHRESKKVTQQQVFELQRELQAEKERAQTWRRALKQRRRIRRQLSRLREELRATRDGVEAPDTEQVRRYRQEILRLKKDLRAAKERDLAEAGPVTGALPDFLIIGAPKCGTTTLYYLLTEHPHVEPAAAKELHFFSSHFDLGLEWYRRCFPRSTYKDGRRTITGEATPTYVFDPYAPARVARVVPRARLIVLLRDPVERAYSLYQMAMRNGWETTTTTFEEALGAEQAVRPLGKGDEASERKDYLALNDDSWYLSGGIYVDQLVCWASFFSDEQMLVLKSEDFSERPQETLKLVLDFLELPDWEPKTHALHKKRHIGGYKQEMQPATRRRLQEYFEPHNRRLYKFLGVDFGW